MTPFTNSDGLRDVRAPWRDAPTSWLEKLIDKWHRWKAGE